METDIALIAKDVAAFLVPALPYLVRAGDKAVEEVGKKIGGEAMDYAKRLWARLRPKAESTQALQAAISDAAAAPEDEDAQAQLRLQLKKLLADDEQLAKELAEVLADAQKAGVTVIASGDRAVALNNSNNNQINTGDRTYERQPESDN